MSEAPFGDFEGAGLWDSHDRQRERVIHAIHQIHIYTHQTVSFVGDHV